MEKRSLNANGPAMMESSRPLHLPKSDLANPNQPSLAKKKRTRKSFTVPWPRALFHVRLGLLSMTRALIHHLRPDTWGGPSQTQEATLKLSKKNIFSNKQPNHPTTVPIESGVKLKIFPPDQHYKSTAPPPNPKGGQVSLNVPAANITMPRRRSKQSRGSFQPITN